MYIIACCCPKLFEVVKLVNSLFQMECTKKKFWVVEFIKEGEVHCAPQCWLTDVGCWWPVGWSKNAVITAMKIHMSPNKNDSTWQYFSARRIGTTSYSKHLIYNI